MRSHPITPAHIEWGGDADGAPVPSAPAFDDVYHARAGAQGQAAHVFLRGNGLPARWAGRRRFVILETGFGLGHNFLATWDAWRADPARCERLHFVSIELHPPRRHDLDRAVAAGPHAALGAALVAAWPLPLFGLHRRTFEQGRVELLLAFGDAAAWLREIEAEVDAFFLDGFAPDRNPAMWSPALFAALPGLAAPGATAATWSAARDVRDGLACAGFQVDRAPGYAGKRDMTVARFAPRHAPARHARRAAALTEAREAVVIGAGLAGAAAAAALAEQGLAVTVVEAAAAPARGASGNAAGLFRSTLQGDDGVHARWYRAAALETERVARPLVGAGTVAGAIGGVLQPAVDGAATAALLQRLGWPAGFVEVVDPARASSLAGLATEAPACLFAAGGWLAPGALVEHWLRASGAQLLTGARVQRLQHRDAACGAGALPTWQALDDTGRVIAAAPVVVLANAGAAADLAPWAGWPLARTRGQVTQVPAGTPGLRSPRRPLARRGYALTLPGGDLLCGATSAADDGDDPALRAADHRHNLDVLERLTGGRVDPAAPGLGGRVGWRCGTPDRLPLVGAVPGDAAACRDARRLDQPRLVPRTPGLFVLCALGSRGITSAALGGRLVAGAATGAPMALEAGLLDALDPARFVARAARRR